MMSSLSLFFNFLLPPVKTESLSLSCFLSSVCFSLPTYLLIRVSESVPDPFSSFLLPTNTPCLIVAKKGCIDIQIILLREISMWGGLVSHP